MIEERQYKPLNGCEVIDYACAELRKAMELSGQFPLHRVFHDLSFVGGIRVTGWGTVPAETKFAGETNGGHPDTAEETNIKLKIEAEPEPPSLVRERLAEPPFQSALVADVVAVGEAVKADVEQIAGVNSADEISTDGTGVPWLDEKQQIEELTDEAAPESFLCPYFDNGCNRAAFDSEAGLRTHISWWCKVTGKKWQRDGPR